MKRTTLLAALLSLPLPVFATEGASRLEPGARVRVTVAEPDSRRFVGILESLSDQSLALRIDQGPRVIPTDSIRRVEVSRGRGTSARWTAVGAVVGGVAGAFAGGCLANKDDYGVLCAGQDDTKYVIGGVLGGLTGGVIGAWLGRTERWDRVDLERTESSWRAARSRCVAAGRTDTMGPARVLDCR